MFFSKKRLFIITQVIKIDPGLLNDETVLEPGATKRAGSPGAELRPGLGVSETKYDSAVAPKDKLTDGICEVMLMNEISRFEQ